MTPSIPISFLIGILGAALGILLFPKRHPVEQFVLGYLLFTAPIILLWKWALS
jgi:hypothetical protein